MFLWLLLSLLLPLLGRAVHITLLYSAGEFTAAEVGNLAAATAKCQASPYSVGATSVRPLHAYDGEALLDYEGIAPEDSVQDPHGFVICTAWDDNCLPATFPFGPFWTGMDSYGVAAQNCLNWTSGNVLENGASGYQRLSQYNTTCGGIRRHVVCIATFRPTTSPTLFPTKSPSMSPSHSPSMIPTTAEPTAVPTKSPLVSLNIYTSAKVYSTVSDHSGFQGHSVSLSGDGNTLVSGGYGSFTGTGASYVFYRADVSIPWGFMATVLAANNTAGASANRASSNAISRDGNTVVQGGRGGECWVFVRTGDTTWEQQSITLIGSGSTTSTSAVSISDDGNTIACGDIDDGTTGSVKVYVRTNGEWAQEGLKLTPFDNTGNAAFGYSLSMSGSGDILVIGGYKDSSNAGGAWVFSRSLGIWSQQGPKLINGIASSRFGYKVEIENSGSIFAASAPINGSVSIFGTDGFFWTAQPSNINSPSASTRFGESLSMNEEGTVLAVGDPSLSTNRGGVWVYSIIGASHVQRAGPIFSTNITGSTIYEGISVSFSSDAASLAIGGDGDGTNRGSAWVFDTFATAGPTASPTTSLPTKTPTTSQPSRTPSKTPSKTPTTSFPTQNPTQSPLVQYTSRSAVLAVGTASKQGWDVSLSSDGLTLLVGAPGATNPKLGFSQVYTRATRASAWNPTVVEIAGSSASGTNSQRGYANAISGDGETLVQCGFGDNFNVGACWVFVRTDTTTWVQEGGKIVGTGYGGSSFQGWSVAITSDGNMFVLGARRDNTLGSIWIFTRTGGVWSQLGSRIFPTECSGLCDYGASVSMTPDGSTIAVGGPGAGGGYGAIWVYDFDGADVTLLAYLTQTAISSTAIGRAMILRPDGEMILTRVEATNVVWVYTLVEDVWTLTGEIPNEEDTAFGNFGSSFAFSGDGTRLALGNSDGTDFFTVPGVYIYNWIGEEWVLYGPRYFNEDDSTGAQGYSVALSSDGATLAFGAPDYDSGVGGTWVFDTLVTASPTL